VAVLRERRRPPVEYELRTVDFPRGVGRGSVHQLLTLSAERGGWELARSRISRDGRRSVVLRRKIIRAQRTAESWELSGS
jgi:uncharacterized protein DUF5703